jgi:glycosyltransferase involved in cell wall biosynthesis
MNVGKENHDKKPQKKILLLLYACSPFQGSEAGVGWNRAIEAAKYFDVWILCKKQKYEDEIKRWIKENREPQNLHFCFIPRTSFEKFLKKFPVLWYIAYNLWHRRAYRLAVSLHEQFHFDLVHQITMCGFREPGYLWKLNIPFVWGPVGGTSNYPWRFLKCAGIKGVISEGARSIFNSLHFRFGRRVRKAAKRSNVLIVANSSIKYDFESVYKSKPIVQLDVGCTLVKGNKHRNSDPQNPLRILWSGRFIHPKAFQLLAMALSSVPVTTKYELKILGKGPIEERWRNLATKTEIDQYCTWMGWLSHEESIAQLNWADVLIFTSLRDTCGTVVLEALSYGVPVICLDHQGVRDVVTNQCGIKIPVTDSDKVISQLRDAIIYLAANRHELEKLSKGAIERAHNYLWSIKGEKTADIYEEIFRKVAIENINK